MSGDSTAHGGLRQHPVRHNQRRNVNHYHPIDYLVDHEGYTRTDAEALVNDFADSEFIEQNDNPLLRTIDLRDIDLKLMYHPDGTMVTDATPIDSELIDLYNLYHVNPDLVLNSFFYQVHVSGDIVTMVEQVYWP